MAAIRTFPKNWADTSKALFDSGKHGIIWTFEGVTTNNTATEIFLEGKASRRIVLPNSPCCLYLSGRTIAYNITDGNVMSIYTHQLACEVLANDTFQVANGVDLDGAGSGNNNVTVEYGASGNDAALSIAGATAASEHQVKLTVTGQSSKTIRWLSHLELLYLGQYSDTFIQSAL